MQFAFRYDQAAFSGHVDIVDTGDQADNRQETGKRFREKYGDDFPYETYKKEVTALFRERYGEGRLPLKPGVAEILQELKQRGVPSEDDEGIKSQNPQKSLDGMVKGLREAVDIIIMVPFF